MPRSRHAPRSTLPHPGAMGVGAALTVGWLLLLAMPRTAAPQPPPVVGSPAALPLSVTASVPQDRFIDRHTPIEFSLSRPLAADDGEIAVIIGSVDVSGLLERSPSALTYRPRLAALPAGEGDIVVYRHAGGHWVELQRFALKVLRRGGLVRVSVVPSATLGSNGQLADGRSAGMPAP